MTTILVVDDHAQGRYLLEALLQGHGYRVVSAGNGAEALDRARESPPDLIVSDILMPIMDGFTLCRHWRAIESLARIPFVFYTATYTEEKDQQLALSLGADRYVIKPAHPEVLVQVVEEVLGEARTKSAARPDEGLAEEMAFLRQHNEALFRKLERKMARLEAEIANRTRAELALRESERFLESIVENIPDMIFVKDAQQLQFVRVNRAAEELLERSREELCGKSDHDCLPGDEADRLAAGDKEALATKRLVEVPEQEIQTSPRGKRLLRSKKVPILGEDGSPRFVLAISEDVTERKRIEERLARAQKMEAIGLLASGVAHDFNNLLSVILAHGDLLSHTLPPDSPYHGRIQTILNAAERAASLTRQLLVFSHRQSTEPTRLNVSLAVQSVQNMLRRIIGENVELHARCAPDLWPIVADQGQIEQVIMNLAINARDAMPDGGRIVIEARNGVRESVGPAVVLSVRDTGVGMTEETRVRLFDPFFSTKGPGKGTGLGLATVHEIVERCSGRIDVDTEPGHGSTFTIYLPRADEETAQPSASDAVDTDESPTGSETILLVEDEAGLGVVITEVLEGAGYAVICGTSPSEALEKLGSADGGVDLLLTDVVLPGMSGPQLADRVRAAHPRTKILFMSGYAEDATSHPHADGTRRLQKPFTQSHLLKEVRTILG